MGGRGGASRGSKCRHLYRYVLDTVVASVGLVFGCTGDVFHVVGAQTHVAGTAPPDATATYRLGDEIEIPKGAHWGQRAGRVSGSRAGPWNFAGFSGVPCS
jgi:hypothetical protein